MAFRTTRTAIRDSMSTYPICDSRSTERSARPSFAPSQKSCRSDRSYVWTEALSGMIFSRASNKLSIASGGDTPLRNVRKYVPPHRVGFLGRFGLKTGWHFAHSGLEPSMVFEGTTECMKVFIVSNSKWARKKKKYANSKWIEEIFCLPFNLSNGKIIPA